MLYAAGVGSLFLFAAPWPAAALLGAGLLASWRAGVARQEERWRAFYERADRD